MLNIFGYFSKKTKFSRVFSTPFFCYRNNIDFQKFKSSINFIDNGLKDMSLSLEQLNYHIISDVENDKFSDFCDESQNSQKYQQIFDEINNFHKNLVQELSSCPIQEKWNLSSILSLELKAEEIYKIIFNRVLFVIHKYYKQLQNKELTYEMEIKILSMIINFISVLIYFHHNLITKKEADFLSNFLSKNYNNGLIYFNFKEKYKNLHDLLKENMMTLLNDNLIVFKNHRYNFLNQCDFNFGNLLSQINEFLLDFEDKIRLSKLLINLIEGKMIQSPEILTYSKILNENTQDLFNLCLKDQSKQFNINDTPKIFESSIYKVKFQDYYLHTFKQINDYFLYILNEKKNIQSKNDFLTVMKVLQMHESDLDYNNIYYFISNFVNENKKIDKISKNFAANEINSKLLFIVESLSILTTNFVKTTPRSEKTITFFENCYNLCLEIIKSYEFNPKYSIQNFARIYEIFHESRIVSLNLLSEIEEKLIKYLHELSVGDFLKILLFYTQIPYHIRPSSIKFQILYYIKLNFNFFNFESFLSIGLALLQISYNKQNGLFDIYSLVDPEFWGKMIEKIISPKKSELNKHQIFKLYMFTKLVNLDPTLENEVYNKIAKDYEKDMFLFETRTISEIQYKFARMLEAYQMQYILEPPLIDKIFSVDFLIQMKKKKNIIVEINGPQHYFNLLWNNKNHLNNSILNNLEENSEIFDKVKGRALVESRYTTLKQEFLGKKGFFVMNISYLNFLTYDSKEKLFNFLMDYLEFKNKKNIKQHYF